MKKSVSLLAVALVTLSLSLVALPACATTVSECKALIDTLITETQGVTITGRNADKDRAGLLGKLSNAEIKLDQGKFADAIQKLQDYETKVNQLLAAGNISSTDANTLLSGAEAAITCISQLG
jgi:FIMAH domain-containing protein